MIKSSSKIIQYNNCGKIVKIFDNIVDVSIEFPIFNTSHVHRACKSKGSRKLGGYFWKYHENEIITDKIEIIDRYKPILQFDLDGNFIKKWNYSKEISTELGIDTFAILNCCRNYIKNDLYYKFKESMWFFDDSDILETIMPYKSKMAKGNSFRNKKEIDMYDLNDNFIKTTNTLELKNDGFLTKTIYRCCNGTLKTTQGYIWKWKL